MSLTEHSRNIALIAYEAGYREAAWAATNTDPSTLLGRSAAEAEKFVAACDAKAQPVVAALDMCQVAEML